MFWPTTGTCILGEEMHSGASSSEPGDDGDAEPEKDRSVGVGVVEEARTEARSIAVQMRTQARTPKPLAK
jgi:hypothetical protein